MWLFSKAELLLATAHLVFHVQSRLRLLSPLLIFNLLPFFHVRLSINPSSVPCCRVRVFLPW